MWTSHIMGLSKHHPPSDECRGAAVPLEHAMHVGGTSRAKHDNQPFSEPERVEEHLCEKTFPPRRPPSL